MSVKTDRLGDAGINENAINSNNLSTEYISELQGRTGSFNYQRMSVGDPIIGMILRVHKNPIRSASWNILYPSEATDLEIFAIDLIHDHLFGSSGSEFDQLLGQVLSMLDYGFSLFEQYYTTKNISGVNYLMPVLEQRMQVSIEDILPREQIVRQITSKGGTVDIPFSDLVFFTLNRSGDDLRGQSLLRNAYFSWKRKKIYNEWMGMGIQRSVAGVPSMTIPKGTDVNSEDYIKTELLLKNITQHENAYMIVPEGFAFTVHESKFKADPVQKCIDSADSSMALSVLAQFILLGQGSNGGAFALSRDQSDFFLDGLQYIVDYVEGVINAKVIEPFCKINFGDKIDPSRIKLTGLNLNKKAGIELSDTLQKLSTSGFLKPTLEDEIQLRDNLQMPELSDEDITARSVATQASPQPIVEPVKLAEQKKSSYYKDRKKYIENTEEEMSDFMKANLLLIKDKLLADIESKLKQGTVEIKGLKSITISSSKYLKGLKRKLAGIAQTSYNRAKSQAKLNKVKLADMDVNEISDKALQQYVLNEAESIVEKQSASMFNVAILTASNNSLKNMSVLQTVANTGKAIDKNIGSAGVGVDGSLMVVGTSNFGETQFYNQIKEQLWGYEFVGIDDGNQSDICSWYTGKTFSVDSAELSMATPPLHPRCRSYLDPIYKSVSEKPEIDDAIAPPSIQEHKTFF